MVFLCPLLVITKKTGNFSVDSVFHKEHEKRGI